MSKRRRGFHEAYQPRTATRALIDRVLAVLIEYAAYLPLTVRQIFYRLVGAPDAARADGGYPKTEQAYERLAETIGKASRASRFRRHPRRRLHAR